MADKPLFASVVKRVVSHPGADRLDLVETDKGVVCATKGLWHVDSVCLHLEPDRLVRFDSDLAKGMMSPKVRADGYIRVKTAKIRGIWSEGFIAPLPAAAFNPEGPCGDGYDYAGDLNVGWYDPEEDVLDGGHRGRKEPSYPGPSLPKYDIERLGKGFRVPEGVLVRATVKIHGCNARYLYNGTELLVGSRSRWLFPGSNTVWHQACTPEIVRFCEANPGVVLYGEVYGLKAQGADFVYDAISQDGLSYPPKFRAFELRHVDNPFEQCLPKTWMGLLQDDGIATVVPVYTGPFDQGKLEKLAEEPDNWARPGQMREGLVIEILEGDYAGQKVKLVSKKFLGRD